MSDPTFHPKRLREKGDLARLVDDAARFEPPEGAQDRIWRALEARHAPLTQVEPDPAIAALLADARDLAEPPPDAQDRIWRALVEESEARAGVREPSRLLAQDDAVGALLARAEALEPPAGRRTRTWMRIAPPARPVRPWAFGALGTAALAAVVFLVVRPADVPETRAPQALALAGTPDLEVNHVDPHAAAGTFAVGDALALGAAADARFSLKGVGDVVLAGPGARLVLSKNDATGVRLDLAAGTVAIHADKRRKDSPLVVAAQGVEVKVVGTIFAVSSTDQGVSVVTREGLVEVTRAGSVFRVGAGESLGAGDLEVHRGLSSPWADGYLGVLAGDAVAAAPVAVAQRDALVPLPQKPLATRPSPSQVLRQRAQKAVPPMMDAIAPEPLSEPVVETPARPVITSRRINLADLARDLKGRKVEELRGVASEAARNGDVSRQAAALYASIGAPDKVEKIEEVYNNIAQLAHLLDVDLGAPDQAVAYLAGVVKKNPDQAAEERFAVMMIASDSASEEGALAAVDECLKKCDDAQVGIARWLRAMVLRDTPMYPAALKQAAANAPESKRAALLTLHTRARELLRNGQLDRARISAGYASQLDAGNLPSDLAGLLRE